MLQFSYFKYVFHMYNFWYLKITLNICACGKVNIQLKFVKMKIFQGNGKNNFPNSQIKIIFTKVGQNISIKICGFGPILLYHLQNLNLFQVVVLCKYNVYLYSQWFYMWFNRKLVFVVWAYKWNNSVVVRIPWKSLFCYKNYLLKSDSVVKNYKSEENLWPMCD